MYNKAFISSKWAGMKIFSMWITKYMTCVCFLLFEIIYFDIWLCLIKILTHCILLLTIFLFFTLTKISSWILLNQKDQVFLEITLALPNRLNLTAISYRKTMGEMSNLRILVWSYTFLWKIYLVISRKTLWETEAF